MTKAKAFLIGLIVPLATYSLPWLFPHEAGEMSTRAFMAFLLIPLVPLSLFIPAISVGKEFRKYAFYGAFLSMVIVAIFYKFVTFQL